MKISTKSQYGLRAIIFLAKKGKVVPLRKISKKEGIPFDYLEKIISRLEKIGLVKSKKGIMGGYFLAKKPEKIKIGEIIEGLEGKMSLVKCLGREKIFCPRLKKCLAKFFWKKLNKTIESALNSVTLSDLIKK